MTNEYRNSAKQALERASQALNLNEETQLRYAALELRMVLECLVYERALNYKEELSNKKLNTWQPKQLIEILLKINPNMDKSSTLSLGCQEAHGITAKEMHTLGTDRRISLEEIKDYYDRLGSYLHTPTLEQSVQGKGLPGEKLRKSCQDLFKIVTDVLNSPIWNVDFKTTESIDCDNCGKKIVRRLCASDDQIQAECIECAASYTLTRTKDNVFMWSGNQQKIACTNPICESETYIWDKDIKLGNAWTCQSCGGSNSFVMGIEFIPKNKN